MVYILIHQMSGCRSSVGDGCFLVRRHALMWVRLAYANADDTMDKIFFRLGTIGHTPSGAPDDNGKRKKCLLLGIVRTP
jgi:hypothetical protein